MTRQLFIFFQLLMGFGFLQAQTEDLFTTEETSRPSQLQGWLMKDSDIRDFFRWDERGIQVFASKVDKGLGRVEFQLYPEEYEIFLEMARIYAPDTLAIICQNKGKRKWASLMKTAFRPVRKWKESEDPNYPLLGLRVALDPGHIAADLKTAEIEGKYVKTRSSQLSRGAPIAFFEAHLTLATAYLIRDQLEALGATVMITRTQPGKSVMGMGYREWRRGHFERSLKEAIRMGNIPAERAPFWRVERDERFIFKTLFNTSDLRARVRKINAFRPDVTLIIHYNVHQPNWDNRDADGYLPPGKDNYCMAFIPGGFMEGELNQSRHRLSFLRLLLSSDLEHSHFLARAFMKHSEEKTGVRPVKQQDSLVYLENACVYTRTPGVYARNLALTRQIQSPLVYGESLCQDHEDESWALSQNTITIADLQAPQRIVPVAEAYVEAVKEYAERLKKITQKP